MKKATMIAAAALLLVATSSGWAATSDTITVTVSLQSEISVSVTPDTWNLTNITLGTSHTSSAFTAQVGNTAVSLTIRAEVATGTTRWAIADTAGADQFRVAVVSPVLNLNTTDWKSLGAAVAAYGSKNFSLVYYMPTSDTKGGGVDQSFTVRVKAE